MVIKTVETTAAVIDVKEVIVVVLVTAEGTARYYCTFDNIVVIVDVINKKTYNIVNNNGDDIATTK